MHYKRAVYLLDISNQTKEKICDDVPANTRWEYVKDTDNLVAIDKDFNFRSIFVGEENYSGLRSCSGRNDHLRIKYAHSASGIWSNQSVIIKEAHSNIEVASLMDNKISLLYRITKLNLKSIMFVFEHYIIATDRNEKFIVVHFDA